jgi:hypothetical protein
MKAALKRGVDAGTLVQLKNSYKISSEAKKAPKEKKPATKTKSSSTTDKKVSRVQQCSLLCWIVRLVTNLSYPSLFLQKSTEKKVRV